MKQSKKNQEKLKNLVRANVNKGVKPADKKQGVIQTIINLLTEAPQTKDSLITQLCNEFPSREESSIRNTVKAQFSGKNGTRIEKERGLEFKITLKKVDGKMLDHYYIKGFKDWSIEQEQEENEDSEY